MDGNWEVVIPKTDSKLLLQVSGGADSAIGLWLYLKHIKEYNLKVKVRTFTGFPDHVPSIGWTAENIIDFVEERFPNIIEHRYVIPYVKRSKAANNKVEVFRKLIAEIKLNDKIDYSVAFRTANPPGDLPELKEGRETVRDGGTEIMFKTHIRPFAQIDKKEIALLYSKEGLMDTLYLMTASCIELNPILTEHYTKPCKKCWWCREKYWAFGSYDGGIQ